MTAFCITVYLLVAVSLPVWQVYPGGPYDPVRYLTVNYVYCSRRTYD